ncbi:hypothetical protein [Pengzhenrongella phosphoraccumulans]|uniref:hypothetical protein n=1 Tax=Pengzhenrongella phosphoraccumulans TaxID=3114394 RepID=UPI00389043A8
MNIAAGEKLRFGSSLVFTYGPWGFLNFPNSTSRLNVVLGLVFVSLAVAIAFYAVFLGLCRVFPTSGAGPLSAVVVIVVSTAGLSFSSFFVFCSGAALSIFYLRGDLEDQVNGWFLPTFAAISALLLQVKFSEGIALLGIVAIAMVFSKSVNVRSTILSVMAFVVSFIVAWSIAGQSLRDVVRWLADSMRIALGFSDAMSYEIEPNLLSYALAAASLAILSVAAFRSVQGSSRRIVIGVLLIVAWSMYFAFKQGFTRHDNHELAYFALAAVLFTSVSPKRSSPRLAVGVLASLLVLSMSSWSVWNPITARDSWKSIAQTVLDPAYQTRTLNDAAARARDVYALPSAVVEAARGKPVAIDPWETSLVWAYGLDWRPVPIFQTYSAYTEGLDKRNADTVESSPEDQVFIRSVQTVSIDGRNPLWESPNYILALACNFRPSAGDEKWVALTKVPDQCGRSVDSSTLHLRANEVAMVPEAESDEIVVARFVPDSEPIGLKLIQAVIKDYSPFMVTADGIEYRLPEGLSNGPLVVGLPGGTGLTSGADLGIGYRNLAFSEPGNLLFETISLD